ncbi:catechol 2,3-dioxygenase-like lactoylglutathione lyase family enzyme [Oceanobacillus polygoni]|uniref:Catechol 2,3-dioxygenase-like lactoylglutathione lyase family enzyme n=1 Tax=Oceanobacillus polygoni TaxID=1235259 RepID=A0A9X0YWW0_9BACI|nr:catechol 2,3-dioxygenase-like lactoylglutathione lyase family enzyme [Oceanobacillus polygoni]
MNLRLELFVESIEKSVEFYSNVLEFDGPKETKATYTSVRKDNVVFGLGEREVCLIYIHLKFPVMVNKLV